MQDVSTVVEQYLATWNETDADRRRELIERTWTEDCHYLDPLVSGTGHDGIDVMTAAVQRQYPDMRFTLVEGPDVHHDRVRFTWHLVGADGAAVAVGYDFGTLADDGRLQSVIGFLETPVA